MAKGSSGPSKSDVDNNVAGWDLVGFESGSSYSGGSSGGSSHSSSGAGSSSSGDSDGGSSYTTAGWGGSSKSGPNMARNPSRAGQTVQEGMYQITYDDLGYAKSAHKTSDSAGYVVNGVTYDGNGNVVSGGGSASGGSSFSGSASVSGGTAGTPVSGGTQAGRTGYQTWADYLNASGYQDYDAQVRAAIQSAVDAATQGYQKQIETADQNSAELARQAYINKMLGQKNLDQKLSASGYAGGMADSQRIQTETNYQNNLNSIEQQRLSTVNDLQSAITQAQTAGDQQLAESLSGYLQNLQSQWASYQQQQESMANSDYWNQKQMDNTNYWNQQQMDNSNYWNQQEAQTQARETARANALQLLSAGVMPDSALLDEAGFTQTEAAAIRSVYLNGQTGGTTSSSSSSSGGSSQKPKLTAAQTLSALKSGIVNDSTRSAYEYYFGQPYESGEESSQTSSQAPQQTVASYTDVKRTIQTLMGQGNRVRAQQVLDQFWDEMSDEQKLELSTLLS